MVLKCRVKFQKYVISLEKFRKTRAVTIQNQHFPFQQLGWGGDFLFFMRWKVKVLDILQSPVLGVLNRDFIGDFLS